MNRDAPASLPGTENNSSTSQARPRDRRTVLGIRGAASQAVDVIRTARRLESNLFRSAAGHSGMQQCRE